MVTTLVPRDDPSKFTYATEKYFINGKEISNESGESKFVAYDDDFKAPFGMKQGYGIFVTNESYIKGSFPFPISAISACSRRTVRVSELVIPVPQGAVDRGYRLPHARPVPQAEW